MIADLRALLAVAVDGDRAVARGLTLRILGSVGSDFVIMYALLTGLAHRRAGEAYGQDLRLFLVAVAVFYVVNLGVNRQLNLRFTEAARASISRITGRLPRLPLLEYEALGRGTLVTRILGDGNQVASCRRVVFGVLSGGLRLVLGALFALSVSTEASAASFVGLILIGVVALGQLGALQAGFRAVAPDDARMYELLRGQVRGGVALKVHRPRSQAIGRAFDGISERVRALRVAIFSGFYERQFAGDALLYGLLGVNAFALPLVADVTSEDVRELNMITLWLVLGVVKLVSGLPRLASTGTALARLQDLEARLDEPRLEPPVQEADLDGGPFAGFHDIGVEALEFRYPLTAGRPAFPLGPVSVVLRRGELVFITGSNGSGKSTFARLLAGLYRPQAGRITVDGVAVDDDNLGAFRALFATIFVEHCLFERTHGLTPEAEARAPALLAAFGIADKTCIADGRISNRSLSTGQRKRLAMVLAQLSDKPILLLDEWAADQDPEFRQVFYDTLLPTLRDEGRLVIVITHDDAYFDRADRRLRFASGALVEVSG